MTLSQIMKTDNNINEHFGGDKHNVISIRQSSDKQVQIIFEWQHDTTNKQTCVPSEDSDQPGHLPSLIRVFAVHSMGS